MKNYRVLITTSGTGSRLKELTKKTNKSLVKINGRAVIDYILDSYPEDVEIVVTLGYFGEDVRKYLEENYLNRKFFFVTVDKFEGEGTSLGYSMLSAKEYLQCPFIFHCNDTIVLDKIPEPDNNWNGGSLGNDPEIFNTQSYSSFIIKNGKVISLNMKGTENFDLFHIGLVGICDYKPFWKFLGDAYKSNPNDSSLNDVIAMRMMMEQGIIFLVKEFPVWYDTGNLISLANAEKRLKGK